jgi:hypothetical protein
MRIPASSTHHESDGIENKEWQYEARRRVPIFRASNRAQRTSYRSSQADPKVGE